MSKRKTISSSSSHPQSRNNKDLVLDTHDRGNLFLQIIAIRCVMEGERNEVLGIHHLTEVTISNNTGAPPTNVMLQDEKQAQADMTTVYEPPFRDMLLPMRRATSHPSEYAIHHSFQPIPMHRANSLGSMLYQHDTNQD